MENTIFSNWCLGLNNVEGHCEMWYMLWIAEFRESKWLSMYFVPLGYPCKHTFFSVWVYLYIRIVFLLPYLYSLCFNFSSILIEREWERESEREGSNIVLFWFQKYLCVYMFECLSLSLFFYFDDDDDVQTIHCVSLMWNDDWWWWPQKYVFVCLLLILFYHKTE